ncbi:MAG TPA: NUDIX domain-containing protein [Candidatus Saccharimonadales bacterium]|nr:NUDIX domain-containing protein [Candidatus Saccharimonadales bacterium]
MINGRFSLIPAVYLILIRNHKILLLRRYQTGYMDGKYSLPAGHIEGHEPAIQAIIREAKEEVGLDLKEKDIELVHTMHRRAVEGDHERIDLFFQASKFGEPKNAEPHKCDELRWAPVDDLPKNMVAEVRLAIENISKNKNYSDFNF